MAKKKPKPSGRLTDAQVARLGQDPTVAAVRSHVSAGQWKQIQKRAKAAGVTVPGYLSGVPRPLQERTPASLRAQALKTVQDAYKPAQQELSDQEKRVKAVDEKRSSDNQYYLNWLTAQSDKMKAESASADTMLQDRQRQIQHDTADAYAQVAGAIQQKLAAQPGAVSDFSQAKAADVTPEAQRANDLLANERLRTTQMVGTNQQYAAAAAANNFALMAANDAKRQGDTFKQLADVASARTKLKLQQAADVSKEVARLLDQEVTKASGNRDFQAVVSKLGIQQEQLAFDKSKFNKQFGLEKAKLTLEQKRLQHLIQNDRLNLQLKRDKLSQDASQFDRKIQVDWYKARHPGTGGGKKEKIGDTNQHSFDIAVGALGSKVRYGKKNKPLDRNYAQAHRNELVSYLIANLGVNRKIASAAVAAFIHGGNSDPGDFHRWVGVSRQTNITPGNPGGRPQNG